MEQHYFTTQEAAKYLRTTTGQLANLRLRGEGPPFIKLKRKCLYEVSEIKNWLDRHKVKTVEV